MTRGSVHVLDSTSNHDNTYISSLLYQEQEALLVKRGEYEEILMSDAQSQPLLAPSISKATRSIGSSGIGFRSNKVSATTTTTTTFKTRKTSRTMSRSDTIYNDILRNDGVVRIDNVIPVEEIKELRNYIFQLRDESMEMIAAGTIPSQDRFADVLLKHNRCDLKLSLSSPVVLDALACALLDSPIPDIIRSIFGPDAIMYELSCLISDPGSQRQVTHPDTPHQNDPVLLTSFIALQDVSILYTSFTFVHFLCCAFILSSMLYSMYKITDDMGPTMYLPGTHTREVHEAFQDDFSSTCRNNEQQLESRKNNLLRTYPSKLGLLNLGSCSMFDCTLKRITKNEVAFEKIMVN
jgi:ectoine hydroxylase-related dioxygenase (phytanoyl-CoA dioxygenase family)